MNAHYFELEWRIDNSLTPMENEDVMRQLAAEGEEVIPPETAPETGSWETYNPFDSPEETGRDSQW